MVVPHRPGRHRRDAAKPHPTADCEIPLSLSLPPDGEKAAGQIPHPVVMNRAINRRTLSSPLKWPGGKRYMLRELKKLLPKRYRHYVELFGGGANLLLALSPEGKSEVLNDVNGDLTNFYRVLQDPAAFARFLRTVQAVPMSRAEWEYARRRLSEGCVDPIERAVRFFVAVRQSLAGRGDAFTGVTKSRTRGGRNAEANAWWNAVDGLPAVHERLKRVLFECRPAVDLMVGHDVPGAVMYADPPYLPETRATVGEYGPHEMTAADHEEFLAAANRLKHASLMISGYPSAMYDGALRGWTRHAFEKANHAAGGKAKRRMTEVVWTNY